MPTESTTQEPFLTPDAEFRFRFSWACLKKPEDDGLCAAFLWQVHSYPDFGGMTFL
jgi:hypothetical protein